MFCIAQGAVFNLFSYIGKESKIYVHIHTHTHTYKTEPLCCTPETNTTL